MSEMVERVKKALRDKHLDCESWPDEVLDEIARAAIAAMREPTEAQLKAVWHRVSYEIDMDDVKDAYQAMIDEALT